MNRPLKKYLVNHAIDVPIARGTLRQVAPSSIHYDAYANAYAILYRLDIDGAPYFCRPEAIARDGEKLLSRHAIGEEIIVAYHQESSGRRQLAWAIQRGMELKKESSPEQELHYALRAIPIALLVITACLLAIGLLNFTSWGLPAAVKVIFTGALGIIGAGSLMAVWIFSSSLLSLFGEHRFSYHDAYERHRADIVPVKRIKP